jgi:hypothetical protein
MTSLLLCRINKLIEQGNCPACGAPRMWSTQTAGVFAVAAYSCGSEFVTANGEIAVSKGCPASSHVAAAALNREALLDTVGMGAP